MKVLLISPLPPPYGGIANWSVHVCRYFENRENINLSVINTAPKKRDTEGRNLWDRVVVSGVDMLFKARKLRKIIKKNPPDVIHINTSAGFAILRDILFMKIASEENIPCVYHLHFGRLPDIAKKDTKEWKMLLKAIKLASCVIALDNKTLNTLQEYIPEINAKTLPNPIDKEMLPTLFEKPYENNNIMYLGWVIKSKGIEELLHVWERLSNKYPDVKLQIVGPVSDEYHIYLKNKYNCNNVVFDGELPHEKAMEQLSKCRIFVLPSHTEGFPAVISEAMMIGKPIVATDVGAISDMLSEESGKIIPPQDTQALYLALDEFLSNPSLAKLYASNAALKALKCYDMENALSLLYDEWHKTALNI